MRECVDLQRLAQGPGPNPRLEGGVEFRVSGPPGTPPPPHTQVRAQGAFTGLDCGFRTEVLLPGAPVASVDLTLLHTARPATVEAYNEDGSSAGTATMSGPVGAPEALTLSGPAIRSLVVIAPADETLLLELCRERRSEPRLMWINHFDLLPGDDSVQTSFNAISSGVGTGLTGLVISSTTLGETAPGGGNKVVHMALQVPPGYLVTGVRVGYQQTGRGTYISQIRLAQVQDPPGSAVVLLDDGTNHTPLGPRYVDSAAASIDPEPGALLISLRVNFGRLKDRIVVRALGLHLQSK